MWYVVVTLSVTFVAWLVWRWFAHRPLVFKPLVLPLDDPLMLATVEKARRTTDVLRSLFPDRPHDTYVKFPFASDGGTKEILWGKLVEWAGEQMMIEFMNRPATHRGRFETRQIRPVAELEDWQVELADGRIRGAFSTLAMMTRVREQQGELPAELAEQATRFVDA